MRPLITLAALTALAASVTALAASTPEASTTGTPGRYTMNQVDGGFLRLDTQTGTVSLCARRSNQWFCEALPDDRFNMQKEMDRLAEENRTLRMELDDVRKSAGADRPARKLELPTEEEVDKAIGYMERMLKKFRGILERGEDGGPGHKL